MATSFGFTAGPSLVAAGHLLELSKQTGGTKTSSWKEQGPRRGASLFTSFYKPKALVLHSVGVWVRQRTLCVSNLQCKAAIIRQISPAEALRELNKWKTESRLGCIYTVAGTDAVFSVRKGTLEIRGSDLFFDAESCKALMHLSNGEEYNLIEPVDLPLTLRQGFPRLSAAGLLVRFHNGDACFFQVER